MTYTQKITFGNVAASASAASVDPPPCAHWTVSLPRTRGRRSKLGFDGAGNADIGDPGRGI